MDLGALKQACALIRSTNNQGTGYLISRTQVATCAHVITENGEEVKVFFDSESVPRRGRVVAVDKLTDSAIILLSDEVSIEPLALGSACPSEVVWRGFGYGAVVQGSGAVVTGTVRDPRSRDDLKTPSLQLFSPEAAAGMAARLNGFSGSPIVVGHCVVGHLKRILEDPEHKGQPALGILYATPADMIAELAGMKPACKLDEQQTQGPSKIELPQLQEGEYHVLLNYRPPDIRFAAELSTRLLDQNFNVLLDPVEMPAAEDSRLAMLARCRSAAVVVSRRWVDSAVCRDHVAALLDYRSKNPSFRIVFVQIDETAMPKEQADAERIDFSKVGGPKGPPLVELVDALIGNKPAAANSESDEFKYRESDLIDRMMSALGDATYIGPQRVQKIWDQWKTLKLPLQAPGLFAAQRLISAGEMESALKILADIPDSLRCRQLKGLALAKLNQIEDAIALLEPLAQSDALDPESGGILAGRYKQMWLRDGSLDWLRKSFEQYRKTYKKTGDSFNGVNAATMALLLGSSAAPTIAAEVQAKLKAVSATQLSYWDVATLAELSLILNDLPSAQLWYAQAAVECSALHQDVSVMRKQARLILRKIGQPENSFDDVFRIPSVCIFRSTAEAHLQRGRIRDAVLSRNVRYGFCATIFPADLVFVQEVVANGGVVTVCVPSDSGDAETPVSKPPWQAIFERILALTAVTVLREPKDRCYARVQELAENRARVLDQVLCTLEAEAADSAGA